MQNKPIIETKKINDDIATLKKQGWIIATDIPTVEWQEHIVTSLSKAGFQLRYPVDDPEQGCYISAEKEISVEIGKTYSVVFQIWDQYPGMQAGRFEQHIYINDHMRWHHDIGASIETGWESVSLRYKARSTSLKLRAEIIALGIPEKGWGWGKTASLGIRNLEVKQLPV